MIGKGKKWERLKDYPWSSLPDYCRRQTKRPRWLEVSRLLETYSFKDNALGRESYLKYLAAKGAKTGKSYSELERGWCLGNGDFRQRMLDKAEVVLSSIKRESVSGSAVKEHSEYEAGQLLTKGISKLGIAHADLAKMTKSAVEKKALAAWLAKHTMASGAWIATRLIMGHPSSVTQAKAWCRESKEGQKWLSKLDP